MSTRNLTVIQGKNLMEQILLFIDVNFHGVLEKEFFKRYESVSCICIDFTCIKRTVRVLAVKVVRYHESRTVS